MATNDTTRPVMWDGKCNREIWQEGDGDGEFDKSVYEATNLQVRGYPDWKLYAGDKEILKHEAGPPHHCYLDDKAVYDIVVSNAYTCKERHQFWPHDFSNVGKVRSHRLHRGRPAHVPGTKHTAHTELNGGKLYYFTGEPTEAEPYKRGRKIRPNPAKLAQDTQAGSPATTKGAGSAATLGEDGYVADQSMVEDDTDLRIDGSLNGEEATLGATESPGTIMNALNADMEGKQCSKFGCKALADLSIVDTPMKCAAVNDPLDSARAAAASISKRLLDANDSSPTTSSPASKCQRKDSATSKPATGNMQWEITALTAKCERIERSLEYVTSARLELQNDYNRLKAKQGVMQAEIDGLRAEVQSLKPQKAERSKTIQLYERIANGEEIR